MEPKTFQRVKIKFSASFICYIDVVGSVRPINRTNTTLIFYRNFRCVQCTLEAIYHAFSRDQLQAVSSNPHGEKGPYSVCTYYIFRCSQKFGSHVYAHTYEIHSHKLTTKVATFIHLSHLSCIQKEKSLSFLEGRRKQKLLHIRCYHFSR